jgi:hypothetical protein
MAGTQGGQGARVLSHLRRGGAAGAHAGVARPPGAARAVAPDGDAWKTDRGHRRVAHRPVEEGGKAVAPIKSLGKPIGDVLVRRPYAQMQSLLDATQPKGRRYYWKSEYLSRIDPALCDKAIAHAEAIRSPHSAVLLFQIGGALNRLGNDHSAVGNRAARYVLNVAGFWEQAADDDANIEWARAAWNDMKAFSTSGTYINFLTGDEGPERTRAALGAGLQRLAAIKAAWDPENMFRTNRNIEPVRAA